MQMPVVIAIAVVFFVMALGIAAFFFYQQYAGSKAMDDRLGRLGGTNPAAALEEAGILKEPMYPEETKNLLLDLIPKLPSLSRMFEQADFKRTPTEFWAATAVFAVIGAAVPIFVSHLPFVLAPVLAAIFGVLPIGYVMFLRKHRLNKFAAQLCEALELVARALRAGHSLASGLHCVAEEMPEPISNEFGRVYEEQNLGLGLEQSLRNLSERVPNLDLKFFVTAVIIQRQTGGDLAEILDKIGHLIRERFQIMGMVQALTGEGRISGVILIALPFGLLMMMMVISPDYIKLLWTDELGRKLSLFGIVMIILGALAIRKIINIKI